MAETKKFLDLSGLTQYDDAIKEYINQTIADMSKVKIVKCTAFSQFPTTGDDNTIYIDTTEHKIYSWSLTARKYSVVGSDYNDITVINGNF